jgi:hypothetical protein
MHTGRNQSGDVRHVDHHDRPDLIGNSAEGLKIDDPRVGAGTDDDEFRPVLLGQTLDFFVIDKPGVLFNPVGDDIEELARKIHR